jgi:hypothetical protein
MTYRKFQRDQNKYWSLLEPTVTQRVFINSGFVDFRDYFGRFLILFWGVIYEMLILPPKKRIKKRLKRTRKSTEPELMNTLSGSHFSSARRKGREAENAERIIFPLRSLPLCPFSALMKIQFWNIKPSLRCFFGSRRKFEQCAT